MERVGAVEPPTPVASAHDQGTPFLTQQMLAMHFASTSSTRYQQFLSACQQGLSGNHGSSKQASETGQEGRQAPEKVRSASERS